MCCFKSRDIFNFDLAVKKQLWTQIKVLIIKRGHGAWFPPQTIITFATNLQDFEGITSRQSIGSTSGVNNQQILTSIYFRLRYFLPISVPFSLMKVNLFWALQRANQLSYVSQWYPTKTSKWVQKLNFTIFVRRRRI